MPDLLHTSIAEPIRPDYNIYFYTDGIYKVIRFKNPSNSSFIGIREKKGNINKLDAALSRAKRIILELGLCNDWKYFCTFTISKEKADRSDLKSWHKKFSQWLRDQRKKYAKLGHSFDLNYVLIPETHQDGSWHMHGFFSDISPVLRSFASERSEGLLVPDKLVNCNYYDWPDYRSKFGFCSLGLIRNKIAAGFYVTKYLSKQLQSTTIAVGLHLYYCSKGLNRAAFHGDVYGHCAFLDSFLTEHYEFCSVGMTHVRDNCTWDFALEYMDFDMMLPFGFSDPENIPVESSEVDTYWNVVQSVLEGF